MRSPSACGSLSARDDSQGTLPFLEGLIGVIRILRSGPNFIASYLEGHDQIRTVKLTVAVPITFRPSRITSHAILILAGLEDHDKVGGIEDAIQVCIAKIGPY